MAQLKSTNIVGNLSVTGNILASKIIKLGGTSTQILMADGSTMNAPSAGLGTVTSIGVTSSSLTVTGSPITSSGTITIEHPTATATTADIYKIGCDNKGHVVIGNKITPADLGLSQVYKYKGTKTWAELKALTSAEIGDVYSITDKDPDGNTNADWACYKKVTAATGDSYATYWQSLGGKVDLSAYVQGPATSTANAVARYNSTSGKIIKDSKVTIDDSGNVVPATTAASELGSSSIAWKRAYIHQLDLYREKGNNYGRISFYKPTMYTWFEYMSPNGVASPTGASTVQYGEVTSWARRSLIEPNSGYGWTWEAASNSANAAVSGIMALSSATGNLKVKGSVTANGFKHSDATKGNNNYVLLAGGGSKALSEFGIGSGGSLDLSNYVDLTSAQTISGNKTFTGNVITSNNKFEIKATGNTDDSWIKLTNASDDGYYAFGIRRPYNTYGLQLKIKAAGKPESEAEYYDIWNAHNDGSGSGLDADKLDGQEGSYYLNYNNFTNKPTIPAAQIQSDWNQTDTSKADYIKNKPTIPTVPTDYIGGNGKSGYLAVFDAYDSITDSAVTHNSGVLDALGYKMSSKATWQYNSSTDCVELVW